MLKLTVAIGPKNPSIVGMLIVASFIGFNVAKPNRAYAALTLLPDPGASIPAAVRNGFINCDGGSNSPTFSGWISPVGNAAAPPTITVPFGTTSISLDFNSAAAVCLPNGGGTDKSNTSIVGSSSTPAPPGTFTIPGGAMLLDFTPSGGPGDGRTPGTYRFVRKTFTFRPASGSFTTSQTYTIYLDTKTTSQFNVGPPNTFRCVKPDPQIPYTLTTSLNNFVPCPITTSGFTIQVNVQNRDQRVNVNALTACTPTLSGWAIDEDFPTGKVNVALLNTPTYLIGAAQPPGPGVLVNPPGVIPADDLNPSVTGNPWTPFPPSQRNGHGFTFDTSALLPPGGSRRDFYVLSWGFNAAHNRDALPTVISGPHTVTCHKPTGNISTTCQYVPATAFVINLSNINDADNPSTSLRIRVRLDWGTPGQRVIAAGPVDGTTDSLQILDGAAFLGGTHTVDVRVYGVNVAGTEDGGDYDIPTHTSARGCQVSCDTSGTSGPTEPESMTPVNIRVNIHNYGPTPTNGPLQVTVTYPAGYPAPYNGTLPAPLNGAVGLVPPNFPGSIAPNGLGTYNGSFVHGPSGKPMGVYRISATYNGVNYPNCGSFVIGYLPYVRAYGGDIFAGSNDGRADDNTINTVCQGWGLRNDTASTNVNDNTTAGIYGFPGTLSASQRTAAQLGVFALGEIHNVSSSVINGGAPRRLAFANTGAGIPPEGQFAVSHCPNDYWGNAQPATTATGVSASPSLDSLSGNALDRYYHNGAVSLSAQTINGRSGVCTNPKTVNLFVRGNITITGDIKYQNGTCPGPEKIPRLQIVATGSINIASNVTVLDGVYIAQDYPFCGGRPCGGSNGTIYTCTRSNGARIDENGSGNPNLYRDCNNQLTVNGALIATRIKWLRTFGTIRESQGTSEYPGSSTAAPCPSASDNRPAGTRSSNTPGVGSSCASEIINLTPEAYIVSTPSSTRQIDTNFDVVTSLPPLL